MKGNPNEINFIELQLIIILDILAPLMAFLGNSKQVEDSSLPLEVNYALTKFTNTSMISKSLVQAGLSIQ